MRLSNINTQALNNILGSAGLGKKGFILFKTAKTRIIASSLALLTAGGVAFGAYTATHTNSNDASIPTPPPVTMGDSDTPTNDPVQKDQFGILADDLEIDGLGMQNTMLTVEEQAAKIAEEVGSTYKGTVYTSTNKDGSTQAWTSEDDYKKAVEAGIVDAPAGTEKVNYDQNVFVANDGTVFATAADRDAWNQQLKGEKTGTGTAAPVTETEGNYYTAPDGTVWASEAEYQEFVKGSNGQTVATDGSQEVVEQGTGYRDPNGDYWTSEAEYLAYVQSLNGNNLNNNNNNNNDYVQDGTGDVTYEDNYYHAPDGTVWASEAEYLSYINSTQASAPVATATVEGNEENNNYYTAPDGTIWASEAEYLSYTNSAAQATAVTTTEATVVQSEENNNYYTAPDGTIWASEADYLAFTASEAQASKTR